MALKILPETLASDPERLARFTREAQTLAWLSAGFWPTSGRLDDLLCGPCCGRMVRDRDVDDSAMLAAE